MYRWYARFAHSVYSTLFFRCTLIVLAERKEAEGAATNDDELGGNTVVVTATGGQNLPQSRGSAIHHTNTLVRQVEKTQLSIGFCVGCCGLHIRSRSELYSVVPFADSSGRRRFPLSQAFYLKEGTVYDTRGNPSYHTIDTDKKIPTV